MDERSPSPLSENETVDKIENYLLGIFLVKSGSKGDSLLFRYPFANDKYDDSLELSKILKKKSKNSFALVANFDINNHYNSNTPFSSTESCSSLNKTANVPMCIELDPISFTANTNQFSDLSIKKVISLPDRVVSNLFAVKPELCGQKFEIKINDVRFVGHPLLLSSKTNNTNNANSVNIDNTNNESINNDTNNVNDNNSVNGDKNIRSLADKNNVQTSPSLKRSKDLLAFNVVFALRADASHDVVNCYHKCSEKIADALYFEEKERAFLSKEAKSMSSCHDEASSPSENVKTSPYEIILQKNQLAIELKQIYDDLKTYGTVHLKVNRSVDLGLCIPQTVHKLTLKYHRSVPLIGPRDIEQCMNALRPYHAILLLTEPKDISELLTKDVALCDRVIYAASPTKNLFQISLEAKVSLKNVFRVVTQLVYWAKATIIYPLTESNVYIINPLAPTSINSPLVRLFSKSFPNSNLLRFMSEFSFGTSISQLRNPLHSHQQQIQLVNQVIWLLKYRLLSQLHTYVYLIPLSTSSPYLTKRAVESNLEKCLPGDVVPNDKESLFDKELSNTFPKSESNLVEKDDFISPDENALNLLLKIEGLTPIECASICRIAASKNEEDLNLFIKLCPYFDGKNHLEDIMYHENVRRSQLLTLIDKFREVLFTCQYEDAAVSQLCPHHRK